MSWPPPPEGPAAREPALVPPLADADFQWLRGFIHRQSGIDLRDGKRALLVRRLMPRLRAHQLTSWSAYCRLLKSAAPAPLAAETRALLDGITTNETHFFREPRQFELLTREVFPAWRAAAAVGQRPRRVRVWSAACATGEEPFSLAMVLLEAFPAAEGWQLEILASDLSTRVLERASRAVWSRERASRVPPELMQRYLLKGVNGEEGRVKAAPELRRLVRFARLNLVADEFPAGPFDLVLCRNVLIYFDADTRRRVVSRLLDLLAPSGLLLLGHAENLCGLSERARAVIPTVYRPLPWGAAVEAS